MVEGEGFEPSKHEAADLQSAGFDRSPTPPINYGKKTASNSVTASLLCQLKFRKFKYLQMKKTFFSLNDKRILEMLEENLYENPLKILITDTTASTNEDAKVHIVNQPGDITAHLSDQQTAGKGRNGKKWVSPKGKNIYLSIGWKSPLAYKDLEGLSLAVGVIIAKTLTRYSDSKVSIKWPNDVLIEGKKVSGILIETLDLRGQKGIGVVIGIGVNVHMSQKDGEKIDQMWTSLDEAFRKIHDRNEIVSNLLKEIIKLTKIFPKQGFRHYRSEFEGFDILRNKECSVISEDSLRLVTVKGVNDKGELMVQENSEYLSLRSGEVSIREL